MPGGITGKGFVKGDPRIRPGPGRPPDEFRAWCREQFSTPEARKKLAKRLWKVDRSGRSDPVLIKLLAYGFGQPTQHVEVTSPVDLSRMPTPQLKQLDELLSELGLTVGDLS